MLPLSPQDPTAATGMVDASSTFGKTSEVDTLNQGGSGKPHKINKHGLHSQSHHHSGKEAHAHSGALLGNALGRHAHVHRKEHFGFGHLGGPAEEFWSLDDASNDFTDENLLILFEFFANHKDYSGRKLMALDEWEKFFVIFEEHFEGISPGIKELSRFFTKNLELQVDMHIAHRMEKGEASRGLTFENFKIALHETVGHHWHHTDVGHHWDHTDVQDSWDDAMSRQSHGILHGMA
jgi:hypothetical protein